MENHVFQHAIHAILLLISCSVVFHAIGFMLGASAFFPFGSQLIIAEVSTLLIPKTDSDNYLDASLIQLGSPEVQLSVIVFWHVQDKATELNCGIHVRFQCCFFLWFQFQISFSLKTDHILFRICLRDCSLCHFAVHPSCTLFQLLSERRITWYPFCLTFSKEPLWPWHSGLALVGHWFLCFDCGTDIVWPPWQPDLGSGLAAESWFWGWERRARVIDQLRKRGGKNKLTQSGPDWLLRPQDQIMCHGNPSQTWLPQDGIRNKLNIVNIYLSCRRT